MAESTQLMTDGELCDVLRISRRTLLNHLQQGPPRKGGKGIDDIRLVRHVKVGGQRRWSRESLNDFINGINGKGK